MTEYLHFGIKLNLFLSFLLATTDKEISQRLPPSGWWIHYLLNKILLLIDPEQNNYLPQKSNNASLIHFRAGLRGAGWGVGATAQGGRILRGAEQSITSPDPPPGLHPRAPHSSAAATFPAAASQETLLGWSGWEEEGQWFVPSSSSCCAVWICYSTGNTHDGLVGWFEIVVPWFSVYNTFRAVRNQGRFKNTKTVLSAYQWTVLQCVLFLPGDDGETPELGKWKYVYYHGCSSSKRERKR